MPTVAELPVVEIVGWRATGTFLYVAQDASAKVGVELGSTGVERLFLVDDSAVAGRYASPGSAKDWAALRGKATRICGQQSGPVAVHVDVDPPQVWSAWKDGTLDGQVGRGDVGARITVSLERGGAAWTVFQADWPSSRSDGSAHHDLTPCFTASADRIALVSSDGGLGGRPIVRLLSTAIPVQVLGPPDLPAGRLETVAHGLPAAFRAQYVAPAQKSRPATVVYAPAGQEALAAELAKAIPGGATVEPLTWTVDGSVFVVALGGSAR